MVVMMVVVSTCIDVHSAQSTVHIVEIVDIDIVNCRLDSSTVSTLTQLTGSSRHCDIVDIDNVANVKVDIGIVDLWTL